MNTMTEITADRGDQHLDPVVEAHQIWSKFYDAWTALIYTTLNDTNVESAVKNEEIRALKKLCNTKATSLEGLMLQLRVLVEVLHDQGSSNWTDSLDYSLAEHALASLEALPETTLQAPLLGEDPAIAATESWLAATAAESKFANAHEDFEERPEYAALFNATEQAHVRMANTAPTTMEGLALMLRAFLFDQHGAKGSAPDNPDTWKRDWILWNDERDLVMCKSMMKCISSKPRASSPQPSAVEKLCNELEAAVVERTEALHRQAELEAQHGVGSKEVGAFEEQTVAAAHEKFDRLLKALLLEPSSSMRDFVLKGQAQAKHDTAISDTEESAFIANEAERFLGKDAAA